MINLTHYDLDGVVSSIVVSNFIKDITPVATGYNFLNNKATSFILGQSQGIITDLNFSKELFDLIKKSKHKYLYIDHHKLGIDLSEYENLTYYVDERFSACANVLVYFKKRGRELDSNLKRLVYFANDYDMWHLQTEESQILNYMFWELKFEKFLDSFKNGYDEKLVEKYREPFRNDYENARKYLDECKKDEFEFDYYKCLLIYAEKYQNHVTIFYPEYHYYFIISEQHKMSIRTVSGISLEYSFKDIANFEGIESSGCHDYAGGINFKEYLNSEEVTDLVFKCIDTILSYNVRF